MQIDDIEGVRSKRLYRGAPKETFRMQDIEGAHPHKVKRSPRSFAFDDYKDVTTASNYRRPFINSAQRVENQYIAEQSPLPRVMKNTNYKVPIDLYNDMNYYDLPRINKGNVQAPGHYNPKSSLNMYNQNLNTFNRN